MHALREEVYKTMLEANLLHDLESLDSVKRSGIIFVYKCNMDDLKRLLCGIKNLVVSDCIFSYFGNGIMIRILKKRRVINNL